MMMNKTNQQGFTLIETLLYLALFALIIGGGMVAAFQVIQSTTANHEQVIIQEEAGFLLRKLEWAAGGVTSASATATSLTLGSMVFDVSNGDMNLNASPLNNSFVTITQDGSIDVFYYDSAEKTIQIIFMVNNQRFNETIYLH